MCVCVNISNFHVNARFQLEAIRFRCIMPALNKCCTCVLNTDYSIGNNNNSDIQWWRCRCRRWWKAIARAKSSVEMLNMCATQLKTHSRKEIKMGAVWWFRSVVQRSTHRMLRCKEMWIEDVNRKICAHYDENNLHSPLTRVWCHCRHRYFSHSHHTKIVHKFTSNLETIPCGSSSIIVRTRDEYVMYASLEFRFVFYIHSLSLSLFVSVSQENRLFWMGRCFQVN